MNKADRTLGRANGYTHKTGSHDAELKTLLAWVAGQQGASLVMVGPAKPALKESPVASGLASKGVPYVTAKGLSLPHGHERKVIALWPTSDLLAKLDDYPGVATLAVLTWGLDEIEPWRRARGAVDVLGLERQAPEPTFEDPVLLGALASLTQSVNLGSGALAHPLDYDKAVHTLRKLRQNGIVVDPVALEVWARANGWHARDAIELREMSTKVTAGRQVQTKYDSTPYKSTVVELWREIGLEEQGM